MSIASYQRFYAGHHDDVLRSQACRRRARRLGLRMTSHEGAITLHNGDGTQVACVGLDHIGAYLTEHFRPRKPGPQAFTAPPNWQPWVNIAVAECNAAKRRPATIRMRVLALSTFARSLPGCDPLTVTRGDLIGYLSRDEWKPSYVHSVRSTFRVFFRMLYDLGHRRDDPARTLPAVKIPRAVPRPCPDHVVQQAYSCATDERVRLAIRIAVETGMRRAEIPHPACRCGGTAMLLLVAHHGQ